MPRPRAAAYMGASMFIALSQSLGQGFLLANLPALAGELGASYTDSIWLTAAFMAPRVSLSVMLVKIRAQYGLRPFAEVSILLYALVAAASFWIVDLRSAVTVELLSGAASAPLSTLAFLYMLEPLPPAKKGRIGMPLAITFISLGSPLARAISPALMIDGGWTHILALKLAMAALCLALVFRLPLRSMPREKVILPMDLVSFALIAAGFGALVAAFSFGSTLWWTEAPWIGVALAAGIALVAAALIAELARPAPLLDVRWLTSPGMLHFAGVLLLFRIILSEQSAGAPGLFQALGYAPEQTAPLFWVISAATLAGGVLSALVLNVDRTAPIHAAALALIALGAGLDAHANADVAPVQAMLGQGLTAFAAAMFLPAAMSHGLRAALAKGPLFLLNFIILFLATQLLGGVIGSSLFRTFVSIRQTAHAQWLREGLAAADPQVAAHVAQIARGLADAQPDPALRAAEAAAQLSSAVTRQAAVLAYNDAFHAISLLALAALAGLCLHAAHDALHARRAARGGASSPAAPAAQPSPAAPAAHSSPAAPAAPHIPAAPAASPSTPARAPGAARTGASPAAAALREGASA